MPSNLIARIGATLMSALLVSCGATRQLAPSNAEELTSFVLLIKELVSAFASAWTVPCLAVMDT